MNRVLGFYTFVVWYYTHQAKSIQLDKAYAENIKIVLTELAWPSSYCSPKYN